MKSLYTLLFVVIISFAFPAFGIEVNTENNIDTLLDSFLYGGNASNSQFDAANGAIGTYINGSGLWGLKSGIVLSSGNVEDYSDGPNTSESFSTDWGRGGHTDLTSLAGVYETYDAASLSFDFTATHNTISYDFLFGTEEYSEYVGSMYNDVFGVWITDSSGKKTQISYDTYHKPITVNTAWMSNTPGTELDGTTGILRTTAKVVKGQNYNIEFALADSSDPVYDSTVYLSNFVGAGELVEQSDIYGLFIGVNDNKLSGVSDAQKIYNTFSNNLCNFKEGIVLTSDVDNGGINSIQVQNAINQLNEKMESGDKFMFYISSHGGSNLYGTETTINEGDEYSLIGGLLSDDTLTNYLGGMNNIEKWVMLDACQSGGFWGNDNPNDEGDLEKLSNICLFAAATEGQSAWSWPFTLEGIFTSALNDAFSLDNDGSLLADLDDNSDITFDELTDWIESKWILQWVQDPVTVFEREQGDEVLFTSDMWSAFSTASIDFTGFSGFNYPGTINSNTTQIPAPGALILCSIGIGVVNCLRRRKTL